MEARHIHRGVVFLSAAFLLLLLLSFAMAYGLALTVFSSCFETQYLATRISIIATAEKNQNSGGADVRLRAVLVNGEEVYFQDLSYDPEEWTLSDSLLIAIDPKEPVEITYETAAPAYVSLSLQKHEGSGIVSLVCDDGAFETSLDLYSPVYSDISLSSTIVAPTNNLPLLLILTAASAMYLLLWVRGLSIVFKGENASQRRRLTAALLCMGVVLGVIVGRDVFRACPEEALLPALILSIYGLSLLWCSLISRRYRAFMYVRDPALLLLASAALVYVAQSINYFALEELTSWYFLANAALYFFSMWVLYVLCGRVNIAISVVSVVAVVFATANYYVYLFRGTPILATDFLVVGTALDVAGGYSFSFSFQIFSMVLITLAMCGMGWLLTSGHPSRKPRLIFIQVTLCGILGAVLWRGSIYSPALDLQNLQKNNREYGLACTLLVSFKNLMVSAPEGYSTEKVEALYATYRVPDEFTTEEDTLPHLIVVMDESFSDLSLYMDTLDSASYMPFYNSITDNAVKGRLLVETVGGGTSVSEWEFLTSNSRAFLSGSIPYNQYVKKGDYSLLATLHELGYIASAVHPFTASSYNREAVYSDFGFDEFLTVSDFENPVKTRAYVTDVCSFEKVIEVFEANAAAGKTSFIFNVTMQNHSGYTTGYYGDATIKVPGYEGRWPDVEEFLTLIQESDAALEYLIGYFTEVDEPVVLCFFGDHQPALSEDFYFTGLNIASWDELSWEDMQIRYETPFLIWANFDIEEQEDLFISSNFLAGLLMDVAGIPFTPYQLFLSELQEEVSAMNEYAWLDTSGTWHSYDTTDSTAAALLDDYWVIQYNNMFDRNTVDGFFTLNFSALKND